MSTAPGDHPRSPHDPPEGGEAAGVPYAPDAAGGPGYGTPGGYPEQPAALPTEKNHLGTIALVAGLVGLIGLFLPGIGGYLTLFAALVAIIAGVMSIRAAGQGLATNRGLGITGLVLGTLQLVLFAIALIGLAVWMSGTG